MSKENPPSNGNGAGVLHRARPARRRPSSSAPASPARATPPAKARPRRCPACGKPAAWEDNPSRPFCSERCRLLDLSKWAEGSYAIPADSVPDKDEDE
jgi:hypothetical protein